MLEESEIRARIAEHLAARPGLPDVVMFWEGYISALGEAGILDPNAMLRLGETLPSGRKLAVEAMLGEEYFAKYPTRESGEAAAREADDAEARAA